MEVARPVNSLETLDEWPYRDCLPLDTVCVIEVWLPMQLIRWYSIGQLEDPLSN
ncbi:hypothetical protein PROFUN_08176 [Planoprotostelium fungivorum]|uniref:Uncharacterized protein n=1 Tax=Planoprotostelium fungivorum TaxID=1890364 RepID=A0A2P6N638_9EUKA|nr:hypothetical protein PROFUN_08176 [Planoprotostelium fungivorum]